MSAVISGQTYDWSSVTIGGVTLPQGAVESIAYESEPDPSKQPMLKTTGTYRVEATFTMLAGAFREFRDALDRMFPPRPVTFHVGPRDRTRAVRRGDARSMLRIARRYLARAGVPAERVVLRPGIRLARPKGAPRVRR